MRVCSRYSSDVWSKLGACLLVHVPGTQYLGNLVQSKWTSFILAGYRLELTFAPESDAT
jgi:hypothetical protein